MKYDRCVDYLSLPRGPLTLPLLSVGIVVDAAVAVTECIGCCCLGADGCSFPCLISVVVVVVVVFAAAVVNVFVVVVVVLFL